MSDGKLDPKRVFVFWRKGNKRKKHTAKPGTNWFVGRQDACRKFGCPVTELEWVNQ